MANRIIKDSIYTSPNLNQLGVWAERHFYRVLMLADDYGCFESTPAVVRGICYPLQESLRSSEIEKWQQELRDKKIISTWTQDGHEYSAFLTFDKHNSRYAVTEDGKPSRRRRKTPEPPIGFLDEAALKRRQNEIDWERHANKLRQARERGAEGSHTKEEWESLKKLANYQCANCKRQEPEIELTEDHIIPISKGGNNYISNIQPLCRSCNSIKSDTISQLLPDFANLCQTSITQIQSNTNPNTNTNPKAPDGSNGLLRIPEWIDLEKWEAFMEVRKKKKAAQTDYAKQLILTELERLRATGEDPNAILDRSIVGSWKDVYSLKKNGGNHGQGVGVQKAGPAGSTGIRIVD